MPSFCHCVTIFLGRFFVGGIQRHQTYTKLTIKKPSELAKEKERKNKEEKEDEDKAKDEEEILEEEEHSEQSRSANHSHFFL